MRKLLIIALCLAPILAFAQETPPGSKPEPVLVKVSAKGVDVRGIIHDLFAQAKRNYVLQPGVQFALFLQLDGIEMEEALNIVCAQAKLQFEVQNGIYFITKIKPASIAPATPPAPRGMLDKAVLNHKLSTRMAKADIRAVFAEFAKQTSVAIEIDKSVPSLKLDAFLTRTSLKYALDKVCQAAGLQYRLTDNLSILIFKPEDPNKVSISG